MRLDQELEEQLGTGTCLQHQKQIEIPLRSFNHYATLWEGEGAIQRYGALRKFGGREGGFSRYRYVTHSFFSQTSFFLNNNFPLHKV